MAQSEKKDPKSIFQTVRMQTRRPSGGRPSAESQYEGNSVAPVFLEHVHRQPKPSTGRFEFSFLFQSFIVITLLRFLI